VSPDLLTMIGLAMMAVGVVLMALAVWIWWRLRPPQ
jgi:hypothetical protein